MSPAGSGWGGVREVAPPTTVLNENEVPEHDMNGAAIEGQEAPKRVPLIIQLIELKKKLKTPGVALAEDSVETNKNDLAEGTLTSHGWHADLPENYRRRALYECIQQLGEKHVMKALMVTANLHMGNGVVESAAKSDYKWIKEHKYENKYFLSNQTRQNMPFLDELDKKIVEACNAHPASVVEVCRYAQIYNDGRIRCRLDNLVQMGILKCSFVDEQS